MSLVSQWNRKEGAAGVELLLQMKYLCKVFFS